LSWRQRKELLGVCVAKEQTELVFVVTDRMGFFPLDNLIAFDKGIQLRKRPVKLVGMAVCRARTVQRTGKDTDSRLDIFPHRGGKGGSELIIEMLQGHSDVPLKNFECSTNVNNDQL
jgi:hypothetical protein